MQRGSYRLDELGWLQFERLCSLVLAQEAGLADLTWLGRADRGRAALVDADVVLAASDARLRCAGRPNWRAAQGARRSRHRPASAVARRRAEREARARAACRGAVPHPVCARSHQPQLAQAGAAGSRVPPGAVVRGARGARRAAGAAADPRHLEGARAVARNARRRAHGTRAPRARPWPRSWPRTIPSRSSASSSTSSRSSCSWRTWPSSSARSRIRSWRPWPRTCSAASGSCRLYMANSLGRR